MDQIALARTTLDDSIDESSLQAATSHKWLADLKMQQVFREFDNILAGTMSPERIVFLDLEYDVHTYRVHEIGLCDALGNIIIDCFALLSDAEIQRTSGGPTWSKLNQAFSVIMRKTSKNRQHIHGAMDVHRLAEHLRNSGITPDTTVIVWATNYNDLRSLRSWLDAEGYRDIFPLDSKCVRMIHLFRKNLRKLLNGMPFPLRLPFLFPLFHGIHHELSGRNHHALVDAQQTRLMFQAFKALCTDVSERRESWSFRDSAGVTQNSITVYYSTKQNVECIDSSLDNYSEEVRSKGEGG